jgi:hypothetical protein
VTDDALAGWEGLRRGRRADTCGERLGAVMLQIGHISAVSSLRAATEALVTA